MFWIHGGAWLGGSNVHTLYGPDYLLNHDIILVVVNYRVGALGFLSTETIDCPGNFGFKDQIAALEWVKNHISSFGGNSSSVTIFGESAGGASVGFLMESEKAQGLFHKAIQQSGFILSPGVQPLRKGVAQSRALQLAKIFHCDNDNQDWKKIIACLKKVDAIEMISKTIQFTEWMGYPYFSFQPVIEPKHKGAFIVQDFKNVSLKSLVIPLLIGITSSEGLMSTPTVLGNEEILIDVKSNVDKKFPLMLAYDHMDCATQKNITSELEGFYLKDGHNYNKTNHQNFTDVSIGKI